VFAIAIEIFSATVAAEMDPPAVHLSFDAAFFDGEDDTADGTKGFLAQRCAGLLDDVGRPAGDARPSAAFAASESFVDRLPRIER
jgi:hypothetical protein